MLAIYLFKVNTLSMSVVKIGLSIFCILLCICALILPERSAFAFNLDYLEYLNRNHSFVLNRLSANAVKKNTCKINDINAYDEMNESPSASSNNFNENNVNTEEDDDNHQKTVNSNKLSGNNINYNNNNNNINNDNNYQQHLQHQQQQKLSPSKFFKIGTSNTKTMVINETKIKLDENESILLANTLIKKINCENHCKTGKLNPLYEEEPIINTSSSNISNLKIVNSNNLTSFINATPPPPIRKSKNNDSSNNCENFLTFRETMTKF
jgi:hypothetical protein